MHLAEKNNLPALARDRRIERPPFSVADEPRLDPASPEAPCDEQGRGRAERGAEHIERPSPPQPEEQPRADREDAARQQQQIAPREEQRVEHCAPHFQVRDFSLRARDVLGHRQPVCEQRDDERHQRESQQIQEDRAIRPVHAGRRALRDFFSGDMLCGGFCACGALHCRDQKARVKSPSRFAGAHVPGFPPEDPCGTADACKDALSPTP